MKKTVAVLLVATALTGCISGKKGPDETVVIENLPLTLPPNFDLRPPRQGDSLVIQRSREEAQKIILGSEKEQKDMVKSSGEDAWLIDQAGGETRNKSIREIMAEEARKTPEEEKNDGWFSGMFNDDEIQDPTLKELAEMSRKEKEASRKQNN